MDQGQPRKTYQEVLSILKNIEYQTFHFKLMDKGDGFLVQAMFFAPEATSGEMELQKGRKWYISPYSTETEIVETVFKCVRTAQDHEVKENFRYKGVAVYCPHFDINARIELYNNRRLDGRIPAEIDLVANPEE